MGEYRKIWTGDMLSSFDVAPAEQILTPHSAVSGSFLSIKKYVANFLSAIAVIQSFD